MMRSSVEMVGPINCFHAGGLLDRGHNQAYGRVVVGTDEKLTSRGEFARPLKLPGASEGVDSSTVASTSTTFP